MRSILSPFRRSRFAPRSRRGVIVVLTAFLLIVMMAMLAFSIDLGYITTVQTELKRAADAGALAGASALVEGTPKAQQAVYDYVAYNKVGGRTLTPSDIVIETGHWNINTRTFTAGGNIPSAIRVVVNNNEQPLFFGQLFNKKSFNSQAEAIAVYQPRDIQVVLDFSASMNDDSELQSIGGALTKASVEANLLQIYSLMGLPQYGNLGNSLVSNTSTNTTQIRSALGLNNVPYPFASGSWDDYINYVKGSSLPTAYRQKYGKITLVQYWLNQKPAANQTSLLWKGNAQPVTAVKDALDVFLSYLQAIDADDRVGFTIYNSANGKAAVEVPLTYNFEQVSNTVRQRQAGHYESYTNIGDGINYGRSDLVQHARPGAFKLIVLMSDGVPNRPSGVNATQYALQAAQTAAAAGIPIVTISLGAGADTNLMQQIANITGGVHFNVPGGQPVSAYEEQLKQVFRQVADDRPLKLVK